MLPQKFLCVSDPVSVYKGGKLGAVDIVEECGDVSPVGCKFPDNVIQAQVGLFPEFLFLDEPDYLVHQVVLDVRSGLLYGEKRVRRG